MDRTTRSRALKRPRPGEASNPRTAAAGAPPSGIDTVDSPVPAKRGRVDDTYVRANRRRKSIVEPLPRHFGLPLWGAAATGYHSSYFDTQLATLVDSTLGRQSLADTYDLSPWLMSGAAPNFDRQQRAVLQEQLRKRLQEDATIASALSPPSVSKQPAGKRSRPTHDREGETGTSSSSGSSSSSSSSSSSAAARAGSYEQTETQRSGKRSRHAGTFGEGSAPSSGAGTGEVSAESLLRALAAEKQASIAFQGYLRESVQPARAGSGEGAGFGEGYSGKNTGGETAGERGGEDEEGESGAGAAMTRRGKVRRKASSAAKAKRSGSDTAAGAGAGSARRVQPQRQSKRQSKRLRAGKPSQGEQADMEEG